MTEYGGVCSVIRHICKDKTFGHISSLHVWLGHIQFICQSTHKRTLLYATSMPPHSSTRNIVSSAICESKPTIVGQSRSAAWSQRDTSSSRTPRKSIKTRVVACAGGVVLRGAVREYSACGRNRKAMLSWRLKWASQKLPVSCWAGTLPVSRRRSHVRYEVRPGTCVLRSAPCSMLKRTRPSLPSSRYR